MTVLLQAWSNGDSAALEQLAPLVHQASARRPGGLAGESQAHGWQPSDLLQESYVRLLDWRAVHWQSRAQFFATTARMMRRVLVDAARSSTHDQTGRGARNGAARGA